ncbi:MAG: VWA domain-containing protein [Deltaproteobacteria bacterium]|nr:VWA domain-containing protein [Deltaproteobacteria bacterium]
MRLLGLLSIIYALLNPERKTVDDLQQVVIGGSKGSEELARNLGIFDSKSFHRESSMIEALKKRSILISDFFFSTINPFVDLPKNLKSVRLSACQGPSMIESITFPVLTKVGEPVFVFLQLNLCSYQSEQLSWTIGNESNNQLISSSGLYPIRLDITEVGLNCVLFSFGKSRDEVCLYGRLEDSVGVVGSSEESNKLLKIFPSLRFLRSLSELEEVDIKKLVIVNAPANLLDHNLEKLSKILEKGGEIFVIGGDKSFCSGGYKGSSFERILPVTSEPEERKMLRSNLAIVLLLDKSGSMRVDGRIERIRYAVKNLILRMREGDFISVIGFDTSSFVVLPMTRLDSNRQEILARIDNLRAWGGTDPVPAMIAAKTMLDNLESVGVKHLIMLTDGEFKVDPSGILNFGKLIADSGVTISGVLLGSEDSSVMRQLVKLGKGSMYYSQDGTSVPEIFVKDVYRRIPIQTEKKKFIEIELLNDDLRSKFSILPNLRHQNNVFSKPGSIDLAHRKGDKKTLISSWRVSNGWVTAIAFDMFGSLNHELFRWLRFKEFVSELLQIEDELGFEIMVKKFGRYALVTRYASSENLGKNRLDYESDIVEVTTLQKEPDADVQSVVFNKPGSLIFTVKNKPVLKLNSFPENFEENLHLRQNSVLIDELAKQNILTFVENDLALSGEFKMPNVPWVLLGAGFWILGALIKERTNL